MKHKITSKEIRGFYFSQIRGLKRMVGMSMKGSPQRHKWGVSIINPIRKSRKLKK